MLRLTVSRPVYLGIKHSRKHPAGSRYIASARTTRKTSCPTILPLLNDVLSELLPSNGSRVCYRGSVFTARCLTMDAFPGSAIPAWIQKWQTLLDNGTIITLSLQQIHHASLKELWVSARYVPRLYNEDQQAISKSYHVMRVALGGSAMSSVSSCKTYTLMCVVIPCTVHVKL
jgi:hypothetical protein